MRVYVPTETKFFKTADDKAIFPCHPVHTATFWSRYLDVFDSVVLSGRLTATQPHSTLPATTSEHISFIPISTDDGSLRTLKSLLALARLISKDLDAAVCLRMPTLASTFVGFEMLRTKRPFGVEVVGDPADALGSSVASSVPFKRVLKPLLCYAQRLLCRRAAATAYVTAKALQQHYPPNAEAFTTHFSSIQMTDDYFHAYDNEHPKIGTHLIHVGSCGKALYKGQDVLLDAVAFLRRQYPNIHLTLVGGGEGLPIIEQKIKQLGLTECVHLCGHVENMNELRGLLDASHLFVLPSLTEGLPKALIEAMARGLPAIASNVGGVSELLGAEALVPPNDSEQLAAKIAKFIQSLVLRTEISQRNFKKATEYHIDSIRPRRNAYYSEILSHTEAWQKRNCKRE